MWMLQWILIFSIIRGLNTTEWSLMRLCTLSLPSPKKISKYGRVCSLLSLSHISLGLLDIFSLDCLIAKPTRKTKTAETLLDLILTNDKKKVLTSGVVDTQLSDHSLVYTILRSSAPRTRSRKICFRSLKNFSRENFVHDMQIVPSHIIDLFDELDDKVIPLSNCF